MIRQFQVDSSSFFLRIDQLEKFPENLLLSMPASESGYVPVTDRSPESFRVIVDYIRGYPIMTDKFLEHEYLVKSVHRDAVELGFPKLAEDLDELIKKNAMPDVPGTIKEMRTKISLVELVGGKYLKALSESTGYDLKTVISKIKTIINPKNKELVSAFESYHSWSSYQGGNLFSLMSKIADAVNSNLLGDDDEEVDTEKKSKYYLDDVVEEKNTPKDEPKEEPKKPTKQLGLTDEELACLVGDLPTADNKDKIMTKITEDLDLVNKQFDAGLDELDDDALDLERMFSKGSFLTTLKSQPATSSLSSLKPSPSTYSDPTQTSSFDFNALKSLLEPQNKKKEIKEVKFNTSEIDDELERVLSTSTIEGDKVKYVDKNGNIKKVSVDSLPDPTKGRKKKIEPALLAATPSRVELDSDSDDDDFTRRMKSLNDDELEQPKGKKFQVKSGWGKDGGWS